MRDSFPDSKASSARRLSFGVSPAPEVGGTGLTSQLRRKLWWLNHEGSEYLLELVGHIPSHAFRLACYRHLFGMKVGVLSSIHRECRIYNPRGIEMGDHSIINNRVLLDGRGGIMIGNNVSISEGTWIFSLEHDVDDAVFALRGGSVKIGDYAFIGARAIILAGITLGEGAVIAAGAVVTKPVDPFAIVAGNPAQFVRYRARDLNYTLAYKKFLG